MNASDKPIHATPMTSSGASAIKTRHKPLITRYLWFKSWKAGYEKKTAFLSRTRRNMVHRPFDQTLFDAGGFDSNWIP
ncbi:hypothetical protein IG631_05731 [Alternaria alternata]|nr:hypothetical protein IG631_05731 [Alternaria alternata]